MRIQGGVQAVFKKLFYKVFVGGQWLVGYRKKNDTSAQFHFATKNLQQDQWVADPFLFEHQGQHYLFCEQYETELNRAGIGYYIFEDGVPVNKGIVIRQPYHMSYPCIFSYNDTVYMIPETSANKTVELYRAVEFPDKWALDSVLMDNVRCVDSTVFKEKEGLRLLTYEKRDKEWALICYALNMEEKTLQKCGEKIYKTNVGRPAGNLLQTDKGLLRPAQDCSRKYGEALLIYQVDNLDKNGYEERYVEKMCIEQFSFPQKVQRIHTLNQDSCYEVVDVFREQFDLLHGWKIFKRLLLKR